MNGFWESLIRTKYRRIILHVARDAQTGVWALMRNLAAEQAKQQDTFVALGLMCSRDWPQSYREQLESASFPVPFLSTFAPFHSYSVAFLMYILHNPLRGWLRKIRHLQPEAEIIVHFHNAWLAGGFFPLLRDSRIYYVSTIHGVADDHRLRTVWWLRCIHRFFAGRLCRYNVQVTSVSREGVKRIDEILGIPAAKIEVIANGMLDHGIMHVHSADRPFTVGHVGQLHPGKGWQFLLEAVDILHAEGRSVNCVLAGRGPDEKKVKEAAATRPYVHYLGLVPDAGKTVIPDLSALVLATWSEGMPMAVIEAFCAGVPVLATAIGGLPEMIEAGKNGDFIERDARSIADKIRIWLDSPERYRQARRQARETFCNEYNIEQIGARYEQLYNQLVFK